MWLGSVDPPRCSPSLPRVTSLQNKRYSRRRGSFRTPVKEHVRLIQSAAKKSVRSQPAQRVARRNFGSDANVTYEGAEAVVRQYLPKDEQIVAAYIGLIATGILISKMTGSSKEEEAVTAVAGDAGPVDMVPSMFSDKFDDFISQPGK